MDLKCIEAVEQVAAEFSLLDLLLNVEIGGTSIGIPLVLPTRRTSFS